MLTIKRSALPAEESLLRQSLVSYKTALEAHRTTINVPAPYPEYDILFAIVRNGGDFIVEEDFSLFAVNGDAFATRQVMKRKPKQ